MFAICSAFVFGCLIPYMARRFAKFMPASFGYALFRLFMAGKRCHKITKDKYRILLKKFRWRSLLYGLLTCGLTIGANLFFGAENIFWSCLFLWSLLLLTEIDAKMEILPDLITVPLLIFGFCFAVFSGAWIHVGESAAGAVVGYFLPALASLTLVWKNKDMFGGGDIKLLSGIGAWLGVENLLYVIILSCGLFFVYAIVFRKRQGAFGPAIACATIMVAFFMFGY